MLSYEHATIHVGYESTDMSAGATSYGQQNLKLSINTWPYSDWRGRIKECTNIRGAQSPKHVGDWYVYNRYCAFSWYHKGV
jgi:hypothetical protein